MHEARAIAAIRLECHHRRKSLASCLEPTGSRERDEQARGRIDAAFLNRHPTIARWSGIEVAAVGLRPQHPPRPPAVRVASLQEPFGGQRASAWLGAWYDGAVAALEEELS
jgi:hypothetical protein